MEIARTSLRPRLLAAPSMLKSHCHATRRCYSAPSAQRTKKAVPPALRAGVYRLRQNNATFVTRDGTLKTSPENLDFLRAYAIEPDHGQMQNLYSFPEIRRAKYADFKVIGSFAATLRFSPHHVLHPFELGYFDPRGHALAQLQRERLARRSHEQPLWLITSTGAEKPCVRLTASRRHRSALYLALQDAGYDKHGNSIDASNPDRGNITGTLWIHFMDPIRAVNKRKEQFAKAALSILLEAQRFFKSEAYEPDTRTHHKPRQSRSEVNVDKST